MSRIAQTFRQLKKNGRKALIPFIVAGDPSLKETERLIYTLAEAGADLLELGVPFSDPMADGPVIQAASERALKNGVTLAAIFKLVGRVRRKTNIPLILMGYYNPIFVMGLEAFARKARDSGVDGVLVVDLPPEEARPLALVLKKYKLDLIFLLAPTSTEVRIRQAVRQGSGFLYYVALTGVTGAKLAINAELHDQVQRIRKLSTRPIVVGFGISKPAQIKQIGADCDGVVVGSALVKLIHASRGKSLQNALSKYFLALKKQL